MATHLTKNFTLEELTHSNTATIRSIDNTPTKMARENLAQLATMLQSIRDYYGKGICINCAYRSPALNKAVGGATTSQHMTGFAADIRPADGNMADFLRMLLEWAKTHVYDQIILEQCNANGIPAWIHIGYKHVLRGQRRQQLLAKKVNGKWQYSLYKAS